MEVKKIKNEFGLYDIVLVKGSKRLKIIFSGNLDLYWSLYDIDNLQEICEFPVTKENYRVYLLFEELYDRIKKCEVSRLDEQTIGLCENIEQFNRYKRGIELYNKNVYIREQNNPNRLFNNGIVEWHCDDTNYDDANVLRIIKKDEDEFLIQLQCSPKEFSNRHSVRIRNSRSGHKPFNTLFMDMYNSFQDYDIDDNQIYIQEYAYQKKLEMRKKN
ncbi:MAG: hypothetical protein E7165_00950 [Firmicutes bacterium]|nr:hypothetical protein [Bacillota bacterium]